MGAHNFTTNTALNTQNFHGTTYSTFGIPDAAPACTSLRRRILKAFMLLAVTSLAFVIFFHQISRFRRHPSTPGESDKKPHKWPIPSDVAIDRCTDWTHRGSIRPSRRPSIGMPIIHTAHNLSVSSELFFLSRGLSTGIVQVITSDEVGDVAKVDVIVTHYDRQDGRVCVLKRGEDHIGIGIFTPDDMSHAHNGRIEVNVIIRLPVLSGNTPLHISRFETDLPLFAHQISDLRDLVDFDSLTLKTSYMPIFVESLSAVTASLTTSNSLIEGSFNASSLLTLVTSNAPIKVDVGLVNHHRSNLTDLLMVTSNAPLDASISLLSEHTSGQFRVIATTSLDTLDIDFPTSPVGSALVLDAHTSLSPATISMNSAYEGTFSLRSSFVQPVVEYNEEVEDPAGNGRHRKVEIHSYHRDSVEGSVSWDSSKAVKSRGAINVETSLAPIIFKF